MENRITKLLGIKYPIIQGGMVWCSGWELASSVSNCGGLGLLGSGSMNAELLREHIRKTKAATSKPFGVNIPLMNHHADENINVCLEEGVKIIFTSAGNPAKWTKTLKEKGITVVHVIASLKFAKKCEEAGVDAVVAEGFEAGGHNGADETTTLCLIPHLHQNITIPLIAAGGIATGRTMLAAMALGADGVQIGSAFAVAKESSAHEEFKKLVCQMKDGDTRLAIKKHSPTRLILNDFAKNIMEMESKGATSEELKEFLGKGRAKKGIFEGDLVEGELEIGQIASVLNEVKSVKQIFDEIVEEFNSANAELSRIEL